MSHLKMGITWYHIILVSLVSEATREKTNIRWSKVVSSQRNKFVERNVELNNAPKNAHTYPEEIGDWHISLHLDDFVLYM